MQAIVLIAASLLLLATCARVQTYHYIRIRLRADEARRRNATPSQLRSRQSRLLD